jgi:hypothetical protein
LSSLEQARRIAGIAQDKLADGRRDPRHAAGLHLHGLLRRLLGPQPAAGEVDLGRGARAAEAEDARFRAPSTASASRRGSSPTTSTSSCTSSRPSSRAYYRLEDLWGDVPSVELEAASP